MLSRRRNSSVLIDIYPSVLNPITIIRSYSIIQPLQSVGMLQGCLCSPGGIYFPVAAVSALACHTI